VLFTRNGWQARPLIYYDLRFPVLSRDAQDTDLCCIPPTGRRPPYAVKLFVACAGN
jgi:hypothetical protein